MTLPMHIFPRGEYRYSSYDVYQAPLFAQFLWVKGQYCSRRTVWENLQCTRPTCYIHWKVSGHSCLYTYMHYKRRKIAWETCTKSTRKQCTCIVKRTLMHTVIYNTFLYVHVIVVSWFLQCMGYVPREGCMYFRGRSPRSTYRARGRYYPRHLKP